MCRTGTVATKAAGTARRARVDAGSVTGGAARKSLVDDEAAPGTRRSPTIADIRAQSRAPVRCLRPQATYTKKFAGTKPANSRENVDGWFTSGTRSRPGRSRMRTAYKLAPDGTRPEAVRNTIGSKACNKACNKGHSNTVSPRLPRRQEHRSKRSRNHAPKQQVLRRDPLPA